MYDFHLHLARLPEPSTLAELLYRHKYGFIAVACEPWEWKSIVEIRNASAGEKWGSFQTAFGIHPMIAAQSSPAMLNELRELLEQNSSAQVGETGLDKRYDGYEPGGIQEQVFLEQARMAVELKRDLQIHCVGDYGRIIRLLQAAGFGTTPRPIFHRFGGDIGIVKAGLSMGAHFSIHADSFRKKSTAEAIAEIPADSLHIETDADETFAQRFSLTTPEGCYKVLLEQMTKLHELI